MSSFHCIDPALATERKTDGGGFERVPPSAGC